MVSSVIQLINVSSVYTIAHRNRSNQRISLQVTVPSQTNIINRLLNQSCQQLLDQLHLWRSQWTSRWTRMNHSVLAQTTRKLIIQRLSFQYMFSLPISGLLLLMCRKEAQHPGIWRSVSIVAYPMNFFFIMNFSFPQRGDTILSVNRRKVQNLKAFYQNIRVAHPTARIEVKRPLTMEETPVEIKDNLPPDLRDAIERRPGYHYEVRDNFYECYAFSCYNSFFPFRWFRSTVFEGCVSGLPSRQGTIEW